MSSFAAFILTNVALNYNGTKLRKGDRIVLFIYFRVFPIKMLLKYFTFLYIINIDRELGDDHL